MMARLRLIGRLITGILATMILTATLFGCSSPQIVFISSDADYDAQSVVDAADQSDDPAALGHPSTEAIDLRHDALVDLRAMGDEQSDAADLLTEQFPGEYPAVPYYVESASFEGTSAWIVFEAWGSDGGDIENRRVWVFELESARVLFTGSVN